MQDETKLKNKVLPLLKSIPKTWVLKTQEVARSGVPDILLCLKGEFIAIELKTDTGILSKLQAYNLKKINDSGGLGIVMTPSNFNEIIEKLRKN